MSIEAIHSIGYGIVVFLALFGTLGIIFLETATSKKYSIETITKVGKLIFGVWIPMCLLIAAATILLTFNP